MVRAAYGPNRPKTRGGGSLPSKKKKGREEFCFRPEGSRDTEGPSSRVDSNPFHARTGFISSKGHPEDPQMGNPSGAGSREGM